jgi:hypothetical protein
MRRVVHGVSWHGRVVHVVSCNWASCLRREVMGRDGMVTWGDFAIGQIVRESLFQV